MIRVLTILAAVVALAVSAAPASAGLLSSPLGASKPPPRTAQVTGGVDLIDCLMTSCAVKPPGTVTPSGGETLGSDWVKAPPKPRAILSLHEPKFPGTDRTPKPPRSEARFLGKYIDLDGRFTGIKDGTSNTLESVSSTPKPKVNPNGIIAILIG